MYKIILNAVNFDYAILTRMTRQKKFLNALLWINCWRLVVLLDDMMNDCEDGWKRYMEADEKIYLDLI